MDTTSPTFRQARKTALIRRSEKLIGWLHRSEYADYIDESSADKLIKLIRLGHLGARNVTPLR